LINLNFCFKVNTAEKISDSFASLDKLRKCLAKNVIYDMAELVRAEKQLSDWFPERSEFSYTDR